MFPFCSNEFTSTHSKEAEVSALKHPCIVFQTNFGLGSYTMYGDCKQADLNLEFYGLTHTIPVFDVQKASVSLRDAIPSCLRVRFLSPWWVPV